MATIYKQGIACLLLVSVFLQTFNQVVICVNFYANQDYIARTLCEYRNKPIIHCGGRCVLSKRLSRQEEQDKSIPDRKGAEPVLTLFDKTWDDFDLERPDIARSSYGLSLSDDRVVDRSFFFFHPPD